MIGRKSEDLLVYVLHIPLYEPFLDAVTGFRVCQPEIPIVLPATWFGSADLGRDSGISSGKEMPSSTTVYSVSANLGSESGVSSGNEMQSRSIPHRYTAQMSCCAVENDSGTKCPRFHQIWEWLKGGFSCAYQNERPIARYAWHVNNGR